MTWGKSYSPRTLQHFLTPHQIQALDAEEAKRVGKGGAKGGGKGKGAGKGGPVGSPKQTCLCCGKTGHLMASCKFNPAAAPPAGSNCPSGSGSADATAPKGESGSIPHTPFPWYCLLCSQPHANPGVRKCINKECNFVRTKEEREAYVAKAKAKARAEAESKGLIPPAMDTAVQIDARGPAHHIKDRLAENASNPDPQHALLTETERLNLTKKKVFHLPSL